MTKEEFLKFKEIFASENEHDKLLAWELLLNRNDVPDLWFCYLTNNNLDFIACSYSVWKERRERVKHIIPTPDLSIYFDIDNPEHAV